MTNDDENQPQSPVGRVKPALAGVAYAGVIAAAFEGLAALPKEFEQYPKGGTIVALLVVAGMIAWVARSYFTRRK